MEQGKISKIIFIIYIKFNDRYMMLIEDENKIYMFDRDNNVFEISHLRFPKDAECTSHLTNTLLDGVGIWSFGFCFRKIQLFEFILLGTCH